MENEEKKVESKHLGCGVCYPHEKKKKSKIVIAFLIIVGLALGYVVGVIGYIKVIGPYMAEMKYKRAIEEYLKPYKEDFIGGNTPEETIDLFIEALKKGDYDLASKYFTVEQQKENKIKLKDLEDGNKLSIYIDKLVSGRNSWQRSNEIIYTTSGSGVQYIYKTIDEESIIKLPDGRGGLIEQKLPAGEYSHTAIFVKNVNNKWKIESL